MRLRFGEMRDALANFLAQWQFEWHASLTFKFPVEQEIGRKRLVRWTREICIKEHLQVAFVAVFNQISHDHLHVLMLGRNRAGKTLGDVVIDEWEEDWLKIRSDKSDESRNPGKSRKKNWRPALIRVLDNNTYGVASYVSSKRNFLFDAPEQSGLFIYNRNLLKRIKICSSKV